MGILFFPRSILGKKKEWVTGVLLNLSLVESDCVLTVKIQTAQKKKQQQQKKLSVSRGCCHLLELLQEEGSIVLQGVPRGPGILHVR